MVKVKYQGGKRHPTYTTGVKWTFPKDLHQTDPVYIGTWNKQSSRFCFDFSYNGHKGLKSLRVSTHGTQLVSWKAPMTREYTRHFKKFIFLCMLSSLDQSFVMKR